jgi:hypothetical protein
MKRSVGVTVIAILSLLGSSFTLLLGLLVAIAPFLASKFANRPLPFDPRFFAAMMFVAALTYILPALWGIVTSFGLFRLKEWARISTIVFSVLLILMSSFTVLIAAVIPIPADPNHHLPPSFPLGMRIFMGMFSVTLVGVGLWWIAFLSRRKVREEFVPPASGYAGGTPLSAAGMVPLTLGAATPPLVPASPLSLTILAWLMLVGGVFIPVNFVLHSPAFLFSKIVTGWPAAVYFLVVLVLQLYVGIGLLRLRPIARAVGVGYYVFMLANVAAFYLAPGGRARMLDFLQKAQAANPLMRVWPNQKPYPFDMTIFFWIGVVAGLIVILLPLYFLITRKHAFEEAAMASAR